MESQKPIVKIGSYLKLSGHNTIVKRICSDSILCQLAGGREVSVPLKAIKIEKKKQVMEVKYINGVWWIVGPDLEIDCGPYNTRAEAESNCVGMQRFEKHQHKPGFVTCDSLKKKKKSR